MFYSKELLSKKSSFGQIWLIAHSSGSHGKKVLSRKNMLTIDVAGVCKEILNPKMPLALRLRSILLGGVAVALNRQQQLLLEDCTHFLHLLRTSRYNLSNDPTEVLLRVSRVQARPEQITLRDHNPESEPLLELQTTRKRVTVSQRDMRDASGTVISTQMIDSDFFTIASLPCSGEDSLPSAYGSSGGRAPPARRINLLEDNEPEVLNGEYLEVQEWGGAGIVGFSQEDQFFAMGEDSLHPVDGEGRRGAVCVQLLPAEDRLMGEAGEDGMPRPPEDTYDMQMEFDAAQPPPDEAQEANGVVPATSDEYTGGAAFWSSQEASGVVNLAVPQSPLAKALQAIDREATPRTPSTPSPLRKRARARKAFTLTVDPKEGTSVVKDEYLDCTRLRPATKTTSPPKRGLRDTTDIVNVRVVPEGPIRKPLHDLQGRLPYEEMMQPRSALLRGPGLELDPTHFLTSLWELEGDAAEAGGAQQPAARARKARRLALPATPPAQSPSGAGAGAGTWSGAGGGGESYATDAPAGPAGMEFDDAMYVPMPDDEQEWRMRTPELGLSPERMRRDDGTTGAATAGGLVTLHTLQGRGRRLSDSSLESLQLQRVGSLAGTGSRVTTPGGYALSDILGGVPALPGVPAGVRGLASIAVRPGSSLGSEGSASAGGGGGAGGGAMTDYTTDYGTDGTGVTTRGARQAARAASAERAALSSHPSQFELQVESMDPYETPPEDAEDQLEAVTYHVLESFKADFGDRITDPEAHVSFFDLITANHLDKPLQAKAFYQVLVLTSGRYLRTKQHRPYGDLQIFPGERLML